MKLIICSLFVATVALASSDDRSRNERGGLDQHKRLLDHRNHHLNHHKSHRNSEPVSVPELDKAVGACAIALVGGGLFVMLGRKKKSLRP